MAESRQSPNSDVTSVDGSVDFSGGVNSIKVTTIQSEQNPNGLARNELAWLINGTVRDGGITPRGGWKPIQQIGNGSFAYQGGFLYQPIDGSDPYLIVLIGGRPFKCALDGTPVQDLFATAYQISANDRPSITIRPNASVGITPGATVPVAADIQSIYGLPASFIAPAAGASKTFFTTGNVVGNVGDVIQFYGSFTIQSATVTYDAAAAAWSMTVTLLNNSYPAGLALSAPVPFGDPHGNPSYPGLTNQIVGWQCASFVSPAIGATVNVVFASPLDVKIGRGTFLASSGTEVTALGFGTAAGFSETITYDSVNQKFVDNIHAAFVENQGISVGGKFVTALCGKTFTLTNGDVIPAGLMAHVDCSNTIYTLDSFTVNNTAPINLVARTPAIPPLFGTNAVTALVGTTLNFPLGTANVTNINRSTFYVFGDLVSKPYFCQGNEFLVIQAGDYVSLPLIWDGVILRKSIGISNNAVAPGTPGVNELPPGGPMDFYMGRFWYSQGSQASAGDITGGASGTSLYNFRDAILNVTENPLVLGGDGFAVPANEGIITAIAHNANQDAALGQGVLFLFTKKGAHALTVPVTRLDWIGADSNNQPRIVPVQLAMGTSSDGSVVQVNGDLFYQDPLADIRTMLTAVRYFGQWGNLPISANINRLIQFTDHSLLRFGSGIYFDNRMIQTALPIFTPQGCIHQALSVLDFEPISSFGATPNPIWEGMYEGLNIMQLFTGVFTAGQRAFAIVLSQSDFTLQLWELTKQERFDNTNNRIQMQIEFPAFTWGNEFSLKQQVSAELWIDRLYGEVVFTLEYRPDGETCWQKWHEWKVCAPRNSCENTGKNPCTGLEKTLCYPLTQYGESYRQNMTLPTPPQSCQSASGRPAFVNYQSQPRLTVKGFCRVRGFLLHAEAKERKLYSAIVC